MILTEEERFIFVKELVLLLISMGSNPVDAAKEARLVLDVIEERSN